MPVKVGKWRSRTHAESLRTQREPALASPREKGSSSTFRSMDAAGVDRDSHERPAVNGRTIVDGWKPWYKVDSSNGLMEKRRQFHGLVCSGECLRDCEGVRNISIWGGGKQQRTCPVGTRGSLSACPRLLSSYCRDLPTA